MTGATGSQGATGPTGGFGTIGYFGDETLRQISNSGSFATIPGLSFTYTVPAGANRIAVNWTFECWNDTGVVGSRQVFARIAVNGTAASGDTGDMVVCTGTNSTTGALTRAFNVTAGATVTITAEGRVSDNRGNFDDNFFTVIPGTQ